MFELDLNPEQENDINQAEAYLNGAKAYVINDQDSFNRAHNMLKEIKSKKTELDNLRKKLKKPINEAAKATEDLFRAPINFLTQAEQAYKTSIINYENMIEQQNKSLDMEVKSKVEQLNNEALEAIRENNYTRYAQITGEIGQLTNKAPALQMNGVSTRDNWKGELVSKKAFILGIIAGTVPDELVSIDHVALNNIAKSVKNTITYPGIRFYNDKIVSVRSN